MSMEKREFSLFYSEGRGDSSASKNLHYDRSERWISGPFIDVIDFRLEMRFKIILLRGEESQLSNIEWNGLCNYKLSIVGDDAKKFGSDDGEMFWIVLRLCEATISLVVGGLLNELL